MHTRLATDHQRRSMRITASLAPATTLVAWFVVN